MGKCPPPPQPERRTCRAPRCLAKRKRQGQENGSFLLEFWQDDRSVYVTVVCSDCGTQHHIEIVKQ